MNTKTDGISSELVAVAWSVLNGEHTPLIRLSDAEAIIAAKDAERWKWITRDGRTRELRIPANENKASIDAAIDGAIKKAMQEGKP